MRFTNELILDAGKLLTERHKRNRAIMPELPARFEDPAVATQAIETLLTKKTTNGFAALRDGKLVA